MIPGEIPDAEGEQRSAMEPPEPLALPVIHCPACGHGIDVHKGWRESCNVGGSCPCMWTPNDIAATLVNAEFTVNENQTVIHWEGRNYYLPDWLPGDDRARPLVEALAEMGRQKVVHPDDHIAHPRWGPSERLTILTAEVGEVADGILKGSFPVDAAIREELIQVAACALSWVVAINEAGWVSR